jgi:hypothetical protein
MANEWTSPRLTEDVHFRVVDGPQQYARKATGPIRYAPVRRGGTVLGYLWAADDQDAAGMARRPAAGDAGGNASVYWTLALRTAKARDLRPSEALAVLAAEAGDDTNGHVVLSALTEIDSLTALRELARRTDEGTPPGPTSLRPRSRQDRGVGCLLAGAVGDALGGAVEFLSLAEIHRRHGPAGITDFDVAYGRRGAITDDTQMTLFTAKALTANAPADRLPGAACDLPALAAHPAGARALSPERAAQPGDMDPVLLPPHQAVARGGCELVVATHAGRALPRHQAKLIRVLEATLKGPQPQLPPSD